MPSPFKTLKPRKIESDLDAGLVVQSSGAEGLAEFAVPLGGGVGGAVPGSVPVPAPGGVVGGAVPVSDVPVSVSVGFGPARKGYLRKDGDQGPYNAKVARLDGESAVGPDGPGVSSSSGGGGAGGSGSGGEAGAAGNLREKAPEEEVSLGGLMKEMQKMHLGLDQQMQTMHSNLDGKFGSLQLEFGSLRADVLALRAEIAAIKANMVTKEIFESLETRVCSLEQGGISTIDNSKQTAWFQECIESLDALQAVLPSIAFPDGIGCGLAGGKWVNDMGMITRSAAWHPNTAVTICSLEHAEHLGSQGRAQPHGLR